MDWEKENWNSVPAENLFHIFYSKDAFLNSITYMYVLVMECQMSNILWHKLQPKMYAPFLPLQIFAD